MNWINVKDELPETETKVLCSDQTGVYLADYTKDGEFYDRSEKFSFYGITHWMPLPKAPGEDLSLVELIDDMNKNNPKP